MAWSFRREYNEHLLILLLMENIKVDLDMNLPFPNCIGSGESIGA